VEARVNQLVLMATPSGKWVLPASDEFLGALGDPSPDYDGPGFAIRNLGFIKLQMTDHTLIEIELHPRNVAKRALRAVIEQITSTEVKLFRIKYFDGHWQSEISASAEHTVSRLEELCAPVFRPVPTSRFEVEGRDFAALIDAPENEHHGFRPLAQKWRVAFGQYDPTVLHFAVGHEVLPLLAIVGVAAKGQEPVFRFLGPGHNWAGKDHEVNAIGMPVGNLPDREYGAWAVEFFRSVAVSGQPRYDMVSAAMRYQTEPGVPQRRVLYERLLLPWRASSNEVFVTSCARIVEKDGVDSPSTSSVAK
jgi:hypothetical protein